MPKQNYQMIILNVTIDGSDYDLDDFFDLDEVLEAVNAERFEDFSSETEDWTIEQMLNETNWYGSGVHSNYQNKNVYEYVEALQYLSRTNPKEAEDLLEAAIECGVDISIPRCILDTYLGYYKSDEDYARSYAEENSIDTTTWPYNCIDWREAADEILQGVSQHNHHYFN